MGDCENGLSVRMYVCTTAQQVHEDLNDHIAAHDAVNNCLETKIPTLRRRLPAHG